MASIDIFDVVPKKYIVIMAGGSGTRMKSEIPKQLHIIGNKPMMMHLIENIVENNNQNIEIVIIVSESNKKIILNSLLHRYIQYDYQTDEYYCKTTKIHFCVQPIANGTGGAIMATVNFFNKYINENDRILILSADVPLISFKTMTKLFDNLNNHDVVILSKDTQNNYGYGRIITDFNNFMDIVEEKDCDDEQKRITLINTGIYAFKVKHLLESLKHLTCNNSQKEYYLTDCPKIIKKIYGSDTYNPIKLCYVDNNTKYDETLGANTPEQLDILRHEYMKKFSIEPINASDLSDDNITRLITVLNQLSYSIDKGIDISQMRVYIEGLINAGPFNKKYIYVVNYEDRIVGTASILIENKLIHNMGMVGHIEDVVIDVNYRKLGLASLLMNKLIETAKNNGCYKIILEASDDVCPFYESLGFKWQGNSMRMNLI